MTGNGTTWNFTYDADGMRTGRSNGTTAYTYTYNGGQLSQMTVNGKNVTFSYDASGAPQTMTYDGVTYYYITNPMGDVTGIANESGTQLVFYYYTAYGSAYVSFNVNYQTLGEALLLANPLLYRGYVYDRETGLYYLQSRYYSPKLGRFLNADALVATGQGLLGNNVFAYCGNNPVNRIDSSGHSYSAICFSDKDPFFTLCTMAGSSSVSSLVLNLICLLVLVDTANNRVERVPAVVFDEGEEKGEEVKETLPQQGGVTEDPEAPPVDAGKQGKHVPGHNNYDDTKSSWASGQNGVQQTQEAWQNGVQDPKIPSGNVRIGLASDGTVVRVHMDGKGMIHGYPLFPICIY